MAQSPILDSGLNQVVIGSGLTFSGNTLAATITNGATGSTGATGSAGSGSGGTYSPTLTNIANITSSTPDVLTYINVGPVVTVAGSVELNVTAAATTQLGVSLPVASNFGASANAGGVGANMNGGVNIGISADATNDRVDLKFTSTPAGVGTQSLTFMFQYLVI